MPMRKYTSNPWALMAYDLMAALFVAAVLFFPFIVDFIRNP